MVSLNGSWFGNRDWYRKAKVESSDGTDCYGSGTRTVSIGIPEVYSTALREGMISPRFESLL